jgi:hypothetical protein
MMGIVVPITCWASNKICNKNHRLHLDDTEYIGIYELPSAAYWSNLQFFHVRFRAHIKATENNKKNIAIFSTPTGVDKTVAESLIRDHQILQNTDNCFGFFHNGFL